MRLFKRFNAGVDRIEDDLSRIGIEYHDSVAVVDSIEGGAGQAADFNIGQGLPIAPLPKRLAGAWVQSHKRIVGRDEELPKGRRFHPGYFGSEVGSPSGFRRGPRENRRAQVKAECKR